MNAIEFAKMSLENNTNYIMGLIKDMTDSPLTRPTSNGGNHPLWILGHLVFSESMLLDCFIQGKENRFPELQSLFDMGSQPVSEAESYPSMDQLFEKFETIRSATTAHLESLSEDDLDKKSHAPEEMGAFFGTVGACFAAVVAHQSFHGGQVADARRAAGRVPVMG